MQSATRYNKLNEMSSFKSVFSRSEPMFKEMPAFKYTSRVRASEVFAFRFLVISCVLCVVAANGMCFGDLFDNEFISCFR